MLVTKREPQFSKITGTQSPLASRNTMIWLLLGERKKRRRREKKWKKRKRKRRGE